MWHVAEEREVLAHGENIIMQRIAPTSDDTSEIEYWRCKMCALACGCKYECRWQNQRGVCCAVNLQPDAPKPAWFDEATDADTFANAKGCISGAICGLKKQQHGESDKEYAKRIAQKAKNHIGANNFHAKVIAAQPAEVPEPVAEAGASGDVADTSGDAAELVPEPVAEAGTSGDAADTSGDAAELVRLRKDNARLKAENARLKARLTANKRKRLGSADHDSDDHDSDDWSPQYPLATWTSVKFSIWLGHSQLNRDSAPELQAIVGLVKYPMTVTLRLKWPVDVTQTVDVTISKVQALGVPAYKKTIDSLTIDEWRYARLFTYRERVP